MYYKRFEEIKVWQDSRNYTNCIYKLIRGNDELRRDFSLCDQLKRATYSIMLNISEGFERKSTKEFANYLNIAKGSSGEVRSILYVVKDNYKIEDKLFDELKSGIESISAQLYNFRNFLNKK